MKPTKGPPAANLRPRSPGPDASRGKATSTAAAHRAAKPNAPSLPCPTLAKQAKEKAGRSATTPAKVTTGDTPLPVGEIITGNPHAASNMWDMSSTSTKLSRASRATVRRMKREAETQKKRIDGLDATMKAISEKLTTIEGTAQAAESTKGGMVPTVVEGTDVSARGGEAVDISDDVATRTSTDAPGDEERPRVRGRMEAEVTSQRSAQSKTSEQEKEGSSSSDESEGEPMEVTYNIRGEAAGVVIGKAKNTLRLIKERTRCISLEVGATRGTSTDQ